MLLQGKLLELHQIKSNGRVAQNQIYQIKSNQIKSNLSKRIKIETFECCPSSFDQRTIRSPFRALKFNDWTPLSNQTKVVLESFLPYILNIGICSRQARRISSILGCQEFQEDLRQAALLLRIGEICLMPVLENTSFEDWGNWFKDCKTHLMPGLGKFIWCSIGKLHIWGLGKFIWGQNWKTSFEDWRNSFLGQDWTASFKDWWNSFED